MEGSSHKEHSGLVIFVNDFFPQPDPAIRISITADQSLSECKYSSISYRINFNV
jgi:hypothetical protein